MQHRTTDLLADDRRRLWFEVGFLGKSSRLRDVATAGRARPAHNPVLFLLDLPTVGPVIGLGFRPVVSAAQYGEIVRRCFAGGIGDRVVDIAVPGRLTTAGPATPTVAAADIRGQRRRGAVGVCPAANDTTG